MATNTVQLNPKWAISNLDHKNQSYALANGGQVLGLNQKMAMVKPPSALTARSVSARKGKGKYALAPMEHRKTPGPMLPAAPSVQDLMQNAAASPALYYESRNTPQPNRSSLKRPGSLNPLPPLHSSSRALQPVQNAQLNPYGVIPSQVQLQGTELVSYDRNMAQEQLDRQRQSNRTADAYSSAEMRVFNPNAYSHLQVQQNALVPVNQGDQQLVLYQGGPVTARKAEQALLRIKSVHDLILDHSLVLAIKRGDLAIIQGEVFKCTPRRPQLQGVPLVLKRIDCVDRRIYDMKVYEFDTFMRFRGHPNLVSLYSYWSEPSTSPYQYKSLVALFEEGLCGDMLKSVVLNSVRPSSRLAMKYLVDILKGLQTLHNSMIVHGSVKPSSIYIQSDNTALLGELGKVELDAARHTHQLFSKVLIAEAMPHTLAYWAPEVLNLQRYGTKADMWSLGVTMYQIVTGEHPFNTGDEQIFRYELTNARIDYSRLMGHAKLKQIIQNLLVVDPDQRWNANLCLEMAQQDFVVDIQRVFRGFKARLAYKRMRLGLVKIQSAIKGFVTRSNYQRKKGLVKETAALMIQTRFRSFVIRKQYLRQKNALMKAQANVLTRQFRRAYLEMLANTNKAQAYIKRHLAQVWYQKIKNQKDTLEHHITKINDMIGQFNNNAEDFKQQFPGQQTSVPLNHLQNFEQNELYKAKTGNLAQSAMPQLLSLQQNYQRLMDENKQLQEKGLKQAHDQFSQPVAAAGGATDLSQLVGVDQASLKNELGDKYEELGDMVNQLRGNLKRVAQQAKLAVPLPLTMQHPYTYSRWDTIHEPHNVVENVLKDDDSVYKALTPDLDFSLDHGAMCFISEIVLWPGDSGPNQVQILVSNSSDQWALVKEYTCSRVGATRLAIPGEYMAKYVRIRCLNNIRGGQIVSTRYIMIKGLNKEEGIPREQFTQPKPRLIPQQ